MGDDSPYDASVAFNEYSPHEEPLQVTGADGLYLPDSYIGYEGGLVVRTPRGGTSVLTPREFGATLDRVKPRDFGEVDRLSTNGHLAPNYVQLKKYGEEPEVYKVVVGRD